jgi:hypothetical protein
MRLERLKRWNPKQKYVYLFDPKVKNVFVTTNVEFLEEDYINKFRP